MATTPAAPGASTIGTPPIGLPVELTTFIGRAAEVDELERLLTAGRLLTLTGAGGSGKTRLALEVINRMTAADGAAVAWVELAALSDPDLLPRQVAATLGIGEEGGRSATETLEDALRDRSLLLVLDNCEHLADACAALADTLLRGCPGLKLLATSREALGVRGERAWLVPPLSMPDPATVIGTERLAGFEAVQLFLARARDVLPSFELNDGNGRAVAEICHRLDGLPLAIELAAARVKVLTPDQIIRRLDNVFALLTSSSRTALPRHRTLRATIDWSYQLLAEPERRLLERLSVFAGGWTIDAAESACAGEGIESSDVLDLMAGLVDRSLVVMREHDGHARYSLLEMVRQYGQERQAADAVADMAARRRHATHYADLAESVLPDLERTSSGEAIDRLRVEQENFRAALRWSLTDGHDLAVALRLVAALWRYWFHVNLWSEGGAWLEAMIAAAPDRTPTVAWVKALNGAGVFAYLGRDTALTRLRLEEAESLSRALGDGALLALTCYRLAHLFCDLGEDDAALARAEEGVRLARTVDEPWVLAEVLVYALAFVHRVQGRPELADAALAEAETIARASDALMALTEARIGRTMLALQRGDVAAAEERSAGAIDAARRLGDHWYLSRALLMAAAAAVRAGDGARAGRLLGAGAALREAAGTQVFPHEQAFYDEVVDEVRGVLGEEEYTRCWVEGTTTRLDQAEPLVSAAATPTELSETGTRRPGPGPSAPALRVLALGPLETYRDGELLPAAVWPYAKPRELLVFLMLHPGGRTREQIGRSIWPESTPAQVKNSFHVTLHHLRKTLGSADWVVIEGDRYRLSPTRSFELDADTFEGEGRRLLKDPDASPESLRAVLATCRGDLLEGEVAGAWVEEHRDRLHRLRVDLTLALGAALEQRAEHADAAELYHALVAREDLNEEAHRRLMRSWARVGQRERALRHYGRLVTLLRDELDADPEPETVDIYDSLRLVETA